MRWIQYRKINWNDDFLKYKQMKPWIRIKEELHKIINLNENDYYRSEKWKNHYNGKNTKNSKKQK